MRPISVHDLPFPWGTSEGKFSSTALGILPKLSPVEGDNTNLSALSLPLGKWSPILWWAPSLSWARGPQACWQAIFLGFF